MSKKKIIEAINELHADKDNSLDSVLEDLEEIQSEVEMLI